MRKEDFEKLSICPRAHCKWYGKNYRIVRTNKATGTVYLKEEGRKNRSPYAVSYHTVELIKDPKEK